MHLYENLKSRADCQASLYINGKLAGSKRSCTSEQRSTEGGGTRRRWIM